MRHTIGRGVAAGAIGTLAMDSFLYWRFRHGGGRSGFGAWESSADVTGWDNAAAPARVGKQLVEGLLGHDVPGRHARALNNATHWSYGLGAGAAYALLAASRHKA